MDFNFYTDASGPVYAPVDTVDAVFSHTGPRAIIALACMTKMSKMIHLHSAHTIFHSS